MPGRNVHSRLAFLAAAAILAAGVAGCGGMGDFSPLEGREQAFAKPFIETPDWAKGSYNAKTPPLGPSGPVAPEDLVDAGGRCAATARAQAPAEAVPGPAAAAPEPSATGATPAVKPSYGSVAGDLASAPMPAGAPPTPRPATLPVSVSPSDRLDTLQPEVGGGSPTGIGGIALGMTECEAVRRGGQPSNVAISSGDKGSRKVVVTYLSGPWPGIYTFDSGRLQEIDAAPDQPKPAKPVKKAPKRKAAPKTAPKTANTGRVTVQ